MTKQRDNKIFLRHIKSVKEFMNKNNEKYTMVDDLIKK